MKHQESINPSDLQRDAAKLMEVATSAAAEADRNLDASAQIIVADADVSHLDKHTILNIVGQNLDKLLPTDKKKRLAIALLALANVSGEVSPVEHSTQNPVQPSAPGKPVLVIPNEGVNVPDKFTFPEEVSLPESPKVEKPKPGSNQSEVDDEKKDARRAADDANRPKSSWEKMGLPEKNPYSETIVEVVGPELAPYFERLLRWGDPSKGKFQVAWGGENFDYQPVHDSYNANGTKDKGLFRINSKTFEGMLNSKVYGPIMRELGITNFETDMDIPRKNTQVAYMIYDLQGFGAWYGRDKSLDNLSKTFLSEAKKDQLFRMVLEGMNNSNSTNTWVVDRKPKDIGDLIINIDVHEKIKQSLFKVDVAKYDGSTVEKASDVAKRIGNNNPNVRPGSMCGPLAADILNGSGTLPVGYELNPEDFVLLGPKEFKDKLPPSYKSINHSDEPITKFDFDSNPLEVGDVVFVKKDDAENKLAHIMVITRIDSAGNVYVISNYSEIKNGRTNYFVGEVLLHSPADPESGALSSGNFDEMFGTSGDNGFYIFRQSHKLTSMVPNHKIDQ